MSTYKIAVSSMQLAGKLPREHVDGMQIPDIVRQWVTVGDAIDWSVEFGAYNDADHARRKWDEKFTDENGGNEPDTRLIDFVNFYHAARLYYLTKSFRNLEILKSDFAAMVRDGHPFTTWHSNGWRKRDNYILGQHLALDFDNGTAASSIHKLAADTFINRYAAYIYSTPSSKPEAPRSRVVFVLDTPIMQANNYVKAAKALLWLFGTADPLCSDPCRPWNGSMNCDGVFLNNVLPLDKVKEFIGQYITTGEEAMTQQTRANYQPVNVPDDGAGLINYWLKELASAPVGKRNHTLNKAAYSLGELVRAGVIRKHDVYNILEPAAVRAGLGKSEATGTIASGLRAWV